VLEEAVAQEAGASQMEGVVEDIGAIGTQDEVSADLGEIYETGGQTAQDQAAYDVARRGVSQRAAGNAANVAISGARRGIGNSGLGAAMAAQSGQDELEALAGLNAQIASSGRDRALQALTARGGLATQQRGQTWNARSERAAAMDLMNRFNASQRQGVELYNKGLAQQRFENDMRVRGAKDAAMLGVAQSYDQQGANARQTAAGVGNAAISYGQGFDEDEDEDD